MSGTWPPRLSRSSSVTARLSILAISLFNDMFRKSGATADLGLAAAAQKEIEQKIHMDIDSGTSEMPQSLVIARAAGFFGWLLAFMFSMWAIGLIPTVPIFVIALMRLEGNEPWRLVLPQAIILPIFIWLVFDQLLTIPWPQTLLGEWIPALKGVIPSV